MFDPTRRYNPSELDDWLPPEPVSDAPVGPFTLPEKIRLHTRNDTLYKLTRSLRVRGLGMSAILKAVIEENATKCEPPLPEAEIADMVASAMKQSDTPAFKAGRVENPAAADDALTDLTNGRRFVQQHSQSICHVFAWHRDLIFDGRRWATDPGEGMLLHAAQVARSLYAEAAQAPHEARRQELARHAARSANIHRLQAMIILARAELAVLPEQLDADPWKLNVENGTIDLKTGKLHPHDPHDLITKLAPVEYHPAATCPLFLTFLSQIFADRTPVITFLQLFLGYCLTGVTREQALAVPHGTGSNGKTTLTNIILEIFGDYGGVTPAETFLAKRGDRIPNDVAALVGLRFVAACEPDARAWLDEALIKRMTGQDRLSARFMRGEFFQFTPAFKLWISANHRPKIRGTDHAIWRRLKMIPFGIRIADNEQDKELAGKLLAERAGILAWMVAGCLAWQRDGLGVPAEVVAATAAWRDEQDRLADFLEEHCVRAAEASATPTELYRAYLTWAHRTTEKVVPLRIFRHMLEDRGFQQTRTKAGRRWIGLRLRTPEEAPAIPAEADEVPSWAT